MKKKHIIHILYVLCVVIFGVSTHVYSQTMLSPEVQEKIRTLESLSSISSILTKPVVSIQTGTTSVRAPRLFSKGLCPQSKGDQEDIYMLQPINKTTGVPKNYIPKNLVDIRSRIQTSGTTTLCVTEDTATALYAMSEDMKKEGLRLVVVSGYRSYTGQQNLFNIYAPVMNVGPYHRVAPPGHSEHQLGTTVDVASEFKSGVDFASTPESIWIQENGHKYGFVISYEQGHEEKTGYMYEPWHIRYVGVANAVLLRKGEYSLAYKPIYYKDSWINLFLGKLKDYVQFTQGRDVSIGG